MKIRTCPNCGYKYSFAEYIRKFLFKLVDSSWIRAKCGSELSFSIGRRTLLAVVGLLPIGFNSTIREMFQNLGLSKGFSWIVFILIFTVWTILIYSFDAFTLVRKGIK